jgi:hypothetical protein
MRLSSGERTLVWLSLSVEVLQTLIVGSGMHSRAGHCRLLLHSQASFTLRQPTYELAHAISFRSQDLLARG